MNESAGIIAILLIAACAVFYFTPWIILALRGCSKSNGAGFVVAINLFLGWTIIGWLIALVMAFAVKPDAVQGAN